MATSLSTRIKASLGWTFTNTLTGIDNSPSSNNDFSYSDTLANGTGADQADLLYAVSGSITASGTLSLDLAGTLSDMYGQTITMARVKSMYVAITTASSVNIGGNANAFASFFGDASDELIVRGGGVFLLHAPDATGYTVTASTGDILDVTNNDGSNAAGYDIAIVGASS